MKRTTITKKISIAKISLTSILSLFFLYSFTQNINTKVLSKDTVSIKIISALPDSFPTVSIILKAQTQSGNPLWDLKPDRIKVLENKNECDVTEFKSLTKDQSINMALVVDHSGSMISANYNNLNQLDLYYNYEAIRRNSPLTKAKKAIEKFVEGFDYTKDSVSIIGFSNSVDIATDMLNKKEYLISAIDKMEADGGTAFLDAMIIAIDKVKSQNGLKIIIALTDGDDNLSKHNLNDVIEKANAEEIPIYVIGLGQVNKNPLKRMASETQGEFYYSEKSETLIKVYEEIKRNIHALYELKYSSKNLMSMDSVRNIQLSFNTDELFSKQESFSYYLPKKVREVLQAKEEEKKRDMIYLYSLIGIAALVVGGTIYYVSKRKKKTEENIREDDVNNV